MSSRNLSNKSGQRGVVDLSYAPQTKLKLNCSCPPSLSGKPKDGHTVPSLSLGDRTVTVLSSGDEKCVRSLFFCIFVPNIPQQHNHKVLQTKQKFVTCAHWALPPSTGGNGKGGGLSVPFLPLQPRSILQRATSQASSRPLKTTHRESM